MLQVDLSKYNALSDVQVDACKILDTYRKMSFKLDESDIFPLSSSNYYVPGINIKYPLTFGQVFKREAIDKQIEQSALVHIFNADELYVIDLQDPYMLSAIGKIAFDSSIHSSLECIRVYEDYLSSTTETIGGVEVQV